MSIQLIIRRAVRSAKNEIQTIQSVFSVIIWTSFGVGEPHPHTAWRMHSASFIAASRCKDKKVRRDNSKQNTITRTVGLLVAQLSSSSKTRQYSRFYFFSFYFISRINIALCRVLEHDREGLLEEYDDGSVNIF